ncbi:MAG: Gfo/Idh/MocA family oxidoreductase [Phycisphaerae bacterium]|nr:Gfo/Idh/MocA family oxidoreductase [Phycisphaerae bacterium]
MARRAFSRRRLVKGAAAGAASLSMIRSLSPALGTLGANERIVTGHIGVGGQGTAHLHGLARMKDIRVGAVCDVDPGRLNNAVKVAGSSPQTFKDFRKLLEMKEVDAVFVVTPGHWHVIPAIQACAAGKDVFVEKPIGRTVAEGRALARAAKKYNRVTQNGTQQRSTPLWINAVQRIKDGELGKVNMIHVWNVWNPREMFGDLGNPPDSDPPPGVDYDMWLGPAPKRPFNPLRWHGSHYFFWDYGGGMMSEWGIHLFDVVTWTMGPEMRSVAAVGGKHVFKDARETPDTASAVFECPGYTMVYSMRHGNGWQPHGQMDHGIEFFGTEATLQINRNGFQMFHDGDRATRKPYYSEKGDTVLVEHERNFFDCMRTRRRTNADAETGHLGAVLGHLANISYRVGRRVRWDAKTETILDDPEANKLLEFHPRDPWRLE